MKRLRQDKKIMDRGAAELSEILSVVSVDALCNAM